MERKIENILYLIGEVKKLDQVIMLNEESEQPDFIIEQYVARKERFIKDLIAEMVAANFDFAASANLIQLVLKKFHHPVPANGKRLPKELAGIYKELAAT